MFQMAQGRPKRLYLLALSLLFAELRAPMADSQYILSSTWRRSTAVMEAEMIRTFRGRKPQIPANVYLAEN